MRSYLLGPILGFVLRLRSTVCLHASAVAIGESAIALVGSGGAGKSSTAAAFAKLGYSVLSDDVVPLSVQMGYISIQPGYPQLKLWPDTVDALFGTPDALPSLTPNWDKRAFDLQGDEHIFEQRTLRLGGVYLLESRVERQPAAVIETVAPRDAFVALLAGTYVNYMLDKDMRAAEFQVIQMLIDQVPVRRISLPADLSYLPVLCRDIVNDYLALPHQTE